MGGSANFKRFLTDSILSRKHLPGICFLREGRGNRSWAEYMGETNRHFISVVKWGLVAANNEKGEPSGSPF